MIKRLLLLAFSVLCVFFTFGQVTTSSITGTVKDSKGAFLAGATITATHLPTGTKYVTLSRSGGVFNIPGMRAGGPYKVTISNVGYADQTVDGLTLTLGDTYN